MSQDKASLDFLSNISLGGEIFEQKTSSGDAQTTKHKKKNKQKIKDDDDDNSSETEKNIIKQELINDDSEEETEGNNNIKNNDYSSQSGSLPKDYTFLERRKLASSDVSVDKKKRKKKSNDEKGTTIPKSTSDEKLDSSEDSSRERNSAAIDFLTAIPMHSNDKLLLSPPASSKEPLQQSPAKLKNKHILSKLGDSTASLPTPASSERVPSSKKEKEIAQEPDVWEWTSEVRSSQSSTKQPKENTSNGGNNKESSNGGGSVNNSGNNNILGDSGGNVTAQQPNQLNSIKVPKQKQQQQGQQGQQSNKPPKLGQTERSQTLQSIAVSVSQHNASSAGGGSSSNLGTSHSLDLARMSDGNTAKKKKGSVGEDDNKQPFEKYVHIPGERLNKKVNKKLEDHSKIIYCRNQGYPFLVSSMLPIERSKKGNTKSGATPAVATGGNTTQSGSDHPWVSEANFAPWRKGGGAPTSVSYANLLNETPPTYDPSFLDIDIATPDKYKLTINLPSYRESIIRFVKASELKKTENEVFAEKHPWLKSNITLSKIRSVKRRIRQIAIQKALDMSTTAMSYVYFEKLVLKNIVTKQNYKLVGAICLFLAVKFYGVKAKSWKTLLDGLEKVMHVTTKDMLASEFYVFKELSFSLFVDTNEILPHLVKLQTSQEYLDHLFEFNKQSRIQEEGAKKTTTTNSVGQFGRRRNASIGSETARFSIDLQRTK